MPMYCNCDITENNFTHHIGAWTSGYGLCVIDVIPVTKKKGCIENCMSSMSHYGILTCIPKTNWVFFVFLFVFLLIMT